MQSTLLKKDTMPWKMKQDPKACLGLEQLRKFRKTENLITETSKHWLQNLPTISVENRALLQLRLAPFKPSRVQKRKNLRQCLFSTCVTRY